MSHLNHTEPPRVYRRVSGSMIKLLFRQRSRFRRMLLIVTENWPGGGADKNLDCF